ncbi:MAG: pilus assembly protein PilZ [SAR86 cluster bacterium]|uniref:Pilus assembly protein PilZ n=1 Tax=SAR86 cluster bacterium TaxID=2030880 RepID=A0A2A5B3F4_9GAMM|nr:MAG: pilus assembly protein PilZ [SAR86 cluster bacterium]
MPFIKNGGVFVASHLNYPIGGELFLIIKFSEELEAVAVLGKVVWKNPKGFRYCGFGVQFSDRGSVTKNKIENLLAGRFDETLPSQTI